MSKLLCALETRCQKLAEDERARAPMLALQSTIDLPFRRTEPYHLPTLQEIDDEWYQKFGKSQGEPPPVPEEEDEFTKCLRELLKNPSYEPTPENNPLSSPILLSDPVKPVVQSQTMKNESQVQQSPMPRKLKTPTSTVKLPALYTDVEYKPKFKKGTHC